jgi:hypothetical protein
MLIEKTVDYWVDLIEKALQEPEENFPNPAWDKATIQKEPYSRRAWIINWLVMSAKCNPRSVVERLKNPPPWLIEWCDINFPCSI